MNRLDFVGKSGVAPVNHVVRGAALRFEGAAPRVSNFSKRWQNLECPVEIPASNLAVVAGVVPNRLFRVERSAGPPDANWIEISFPYVEGSELALEDSAAASFDKAFYRISILP